MARFTISKIDADGTRTVIKETDGILKDPHDGKVRVNAPDGIVCYIEGEDSPKDIEKRAKKHALELYKWAKIIAVRRKWLFDCYSPPDAGPWEGEAFKSWELTEHFDAFDAVLKKIEE